VDQAARLDAAHVIEVKMCLTEMHHLGLRKEDIPGFIELVPYGPDEEERLRRSGYVYL
jgi:intracellular sulfur oxidation DsrE/DsrF family protein